MVVADDPVSCVALGTGKALENIEIMEKSEEAEQMGHR